MMISPTEFSQIHDYNENTINKIVEKIDEQLRGSQLYDWATAIIEGEYSVSCRDEVAKRYIKAGWYNVVHRCSSENGEPSGLTKFILFTEDPFKAWNGDLRNKSLSYHVVESST